MLFRRRIARFALVFWWSVVVLAGGCQRHETWRPAPEETSVRFLQEETARALEALEGAERACVEGCEEVVAHLRDARRSLVRLHDYYLPLLEARERVYEAHRLLDEGLTGRADEELASVEQVFLRMGSRGLPEIERELQLPMKTLAEARVAVRGDPANAHDLVDRLGAQINMLELKADLALRGTSLERR